ncbi:MAG: isoprenylcysteine carboxylmethyltransferase family protein [Anaerolineales bacterium]|nr:isoprenylcysteine carboxylmethyltransferase family protein [Anaerolineales bacterium]
MKNGKMILMAAILTLAAVAQIVLAILLYNPDGNVAVINLGWVILWLSAIFGWLPIFTFKKWGKVPQGKGYIHTTALVDRGVYAIVRHPQYLAGILIGLGLPLISQHWLVAVLGVVVMVVAYLDTFDEERSTIARFGDEYLHYMQRVPRVNFLLGIVRLLWKRGKQDDERPD